MNTPPPLRPLEDVLLPAGPLLDHLETAGGLQQALRGNLDPLAVRRYQRMVHAAARDGVISAADADQLAGHGFGCHPSRIWGKHWWAADDRG